jgi:hypothetical protein
VANITKHKYTTCSHYTRIRIGHTSLTHSHLISKDPTHICNECQVDITIRRIIQDCLDFQPISTRQLRRRFE